MRVRTNVEAREANRQLGLALVGPSSRRILSDGKISRRARRAQDRAAAKLNADQQREIVAARRGTKLSSRDAFTVLSRARLNER